jgi:hypothetical protein
VILLLASRTDPLRHLLPAALEAATPGQPKQLLTLDPDAPGDLALKLSAGEGALNGGIRIAGEIHEWSDLKAAWVAGESTPELGSAWELLLEGLDLARFPVVGRPQVQKALACDSKLDQLAEAAGLGRPDRSWLAADHDQADPPADQPRPAPVHSLWRGGNELHGAAPALRPWIKAVSRFADSAKLLWGRIELEPQLAGPPHVLRVVQEHLPISSLANLAEAPRRALMALGEHLSKTR